MTVTYVAVHDSVKRPSMYVGGCRTAVMDARGDISLWQCTVALTYADIGGSGPQLL